MESIKLMQDIHLQAARFYFANLTKSKNPGYDYLKKRGLSDKINKKIWTRLFYYIHGIV